MGISRKPARGGHESLRGSPPTSYTENFSQKVETDNNRNVSNLSTQQKQYSFSGLCGGRNHLKRRGLAACRGPSASSHFLGCTPHFGGSPPRAVPGGEGKLARSFPSPGFLHFNAPGRGAGEPPRAQLSEPRRTPGGVWGPSAATHADPRGRGLPRRPPQCAKAPRRCGATRIQPRSRGCAGEPPALRGRHERLRGSSPTSCIRAFQPKVSTSHKHKTPATPCNFSASSRFFLLRPEAQKKKAIKKENAARFRRLRAATRASRPRPAPPFEKGGRKL